jgi:serine/threonine protein kinase
MTGVHPATTSGTGTSAPHAPGPHTDPRHASGSPEPTDRHRGPTAGRDQGAAGPPSRPGGPPPHPPGHDIAPGYRVVEHMRRGEECDLYDAWSIDRFSRCVIKTLKPDRSTDPHARRHLLREGRLLMRMTHPHIVRAYELLRPRPSQPPMLVLETLPGVTLGYILDELGQRLPQQALGHLGRHLCSAVRYLHSFGHLHLDIKPGNIISSAGRAQLIDLGVARPPGPCRRGPGTPAYMAPEQARGGTLGPATDVWGIGLVLYHAATGHQPFDLPGPSRSDRRATTTGDLERRYPQLTLRAPRIRARRRLPRPVAEVIDACLSPDPHRRPTIEHLDATLAALTEETDPGAG